MSDIMAGIRLKARDHARSPVQWDDSEHADFTSGKPWMRVNDDYKEWNNKAQRSDPGSVWHFWKKALAFRKAHSACVRLPSRTSADIWRRSRTDLRAVRPGRRVQ